MKRIVLVLILLVTLVGLPPAPGRAQGPIMFCPGESTYILPGVNDPNNTFTANVPGYHSLRYSQENIGIVDEGNNPVPTRNASVPDFMIFYNGSGTSSTKIFINNDFLPRTIYLCLFPPAPTSTPTNTPVPTNTPMPTSTPVPASSYPGCVVWRASKSSMVAYTTSESYYIYYGHNAVDVLSGPAGTGPYPIALSVYRTSSLVYAPGNYIFLVDSEPTDVTDIVFCSTSSTPTPVPTSTPDPGVCATYSSYPDPRWGNPILEITTGPAVVATLHRPGSNQLVELDNYAAVLYDGNTVNLKQGDHKFNAAGNVPFTVVLCNPYPPSPVVPPGCTVQYSQIHPTYKNAVVNFANVVNVVVTIVPGSMYMGFKQFPGVAVDTSYNYIGKAGYPDSVTLTPAANHLLSEHDGLDIPFAVVICDAAYTPTPTQPTSTATATRTPTTTRPPIATWTATTGPSPTATIDTAGCVGELRSIPALPATISVSMTVDLRFVVADRTVKFTAQAGGAIELPPGNYRWGNNPPPGQYALGGVNGPARLWICFFEVTPTGTSSPTLAPFVTSTAGATGAEVCVEPPTAPPDSRGPMPDLGLVIPTFAPLPTIITATVTISANVVISQTRLLMTAVIAPVQTVTTWCSVTFGPNGLQRAQLDATPITDGIAKAFGWLKFFEMIGPLSWVLLPLLIGLLIKVARAVLSVVKYVKQIIPFN